jgi:hypothetical protein
MFGFSLDFISGWQYALEDCAQQLPSECGAQVVRRGRPNYEQTGKGTATEGSPPTTFAIAANAEACGRGASGSRAAFGRGNMVVEVTPPYVSPDGSVTEGLRSDGLPERGKTRAHAFPSPGVNTRPTPRGKGSTSRASPGLGSQQRSAHGGGSKRHGRRRGDTRARGAPRLRTMRRSLPPLSWRRTKAAKDSLGTPRAR